MSQQFIEATSLTVTPDDFAAPLDRDLLQTCWKGKFYKHDCQSMPESYSRLMKPGWKSVTPAGMLDQLLSWQWLLQFRKALIAGRWGFDLDT
jgi:hypothetical protein